MGDRSSIYIESKQFPHPVALYGHWSGQDNLVAVANVLSRTDRVGDANYLTAQVFYEFAVSNGYTGGLSFGIGTYEDTSDGLDDNPAVYLNADTGEVTYEGITYSQTDFLTDYLNLVGE